MNIHNEGIAVIVMLDLVSDSSPPQSKSQREEENGATEPKYCLHNLEVEMHVTRQYDELPGPLLNTLTILHHRNAVLPCQLVTNNKENLQPFNCYLISNYQTHLTLPCLLSKELLMELLQGIDVAHVGGIVFMQHWQANNLCLLSSGMS